MELRTLERWKLKTVGWAVGFFNLILGIIKRILFPREFDNPKKIIIFKVGNIGDILCAIPSFIAVRRRFPEAKITLLTSPGEIGTPGAAELLKGVWFLDEMRVYGSGDLGSLKKIAGLIQELRGGKFDLFVHIPPHEWTNFRTLVRNLFFAKFVGVKAAIGFQMRVIINLFRKTQIDFVDGRKETESLLDILARDGIPAEKVEFDLPVSKENEERSDQLLSSKWKEADKSPMIVIHSGTKKNFPEKRWFPERFNAVAGHLIEKHGAQIIIAGGRDDLPDAEIIRRGLPETKVLVAAGQLSILETAALLKRCDFVLGIDSGLLHLAAALGKPTVGLYSNLDIFGNWFPYGNSHIPVFHRFLNCDYRSSVCVRRSMEMITTSEVESACDRMLNKLNK